MRQGQAGLQGAAGQRLGGHAQAQQLTAFFGQRVGIAVFAHVNQPAGGFLGGLKPPVASRQRGFKPGLQAFGLRVGEQTGLQAFSGDASSDRVQTSGGVGKVGWSQWWRGVARRGRQRSGTQLLGFLRRQNAQRLGSDLLAQALRLGLAGGAQADRRQQAASPGPVAQIGQHQQHHQPNHSAAPLARPRGRTLTSELVISFMPVEVCTSRAPFSATPQAVPAIAASPPDS